MFVVVVVVVEVVVLICLSSIHLTAGFTFIISSNIAQYFWKLPVELVGHFCVRVITLFYLSLQKTPQSLCMGAVSLSSTWLSGVASSIMARTV